MPRLSDVTVKTAPDRSSNNPPVFRCMSLPNVTSYPAVTNLGIAEIFISYFISFVVTVELNRMRSAMHFRGSR